MIFKLAFLNVISKKSSYVIILFMAFAVSLFCVSNAVFDSTENGIQTNFKASFTGDIMIRPNSKKQFSLFGDETPVTGSLTKLDTLTSYSEIKNVLNNIDEIQSYVPQMSGAAALEFNGTRNATFLFGVYADEYFSVMKSIHVISGEKYKKGTKSVMLSEHMANKSGAKVGDEVQFSIAYGPYFRIRKATVTGIYKYENNNATYDRFIIIDPDTLRDILDVAENQIVKDEDIEIEKSFLLEDDLDFDALFEDSTDSFANNSEINDIEVFSEISIDEEEPEEYYESVLWNYIICRVKPGSNPDKVIKKLNKEFKKCNFEVNATDWRHAAGSAALYIYWIRYIFNIGIAIVLCAGFIIVNNTLVINVLDRTREIGTLRAIGAKKRFISIQCMVETFIMTLTSWVIGIFIGIGMSNLITKIGIQFNNSFLIQLFGSDALLVKVIPSNVLKLLVLVILLGVVGWIYPVITAVKVNPVKAMQGAK